MVESVLNRASMVGDGLFETLKVVDGRIINDLNHYDRLAKGAQILKFDESQILVAWSDLKEKCLSKTGRVRLTIWRREGAGYAGNSSDVAFDVNIREGITPLFLVDKEYSSVLYDKNLKVSKNELNAVKSISASLYVQATNYALTRGFDESVLLNERGEVVEFGSSNLFARKGGVWYTPSLESGCLPGTMRKYLIDHQNDLDIEVKEGVLYPNDLSDADALMLSNAIRGVQPVTMFNGITLVSKSQVERILERLNKSFGLI